MKNKVKIALYCFALVLAMASCADEKLLEFQITKPLSIADVEYLNSYDALKTYVDRSANANFKLGASASIADFTGKGLIYRLLSADFDEISVDGMTQGPVVSDNGAYDFGNISTLLAVAGDTQVSVFGNSLVSHEKQGATFLNGLLADSLIIDMVWVASGIDGEMLVNGDFASDDYSQSFIIQNGGTTGELTTGPNGVGRALKVINPAVQSAAYNSQFIIKWDGNTPMKQGEQWTIKMDYKSDVACDFGNQGQSGPGNYQISNLIPSMSSTSAWQTLDITITVDANQASKGVTAIAFDLGNTATNYYFANVSVYKHPTITETEMLVNGGFEDADWSASFIVQNGGTTGELTTGNNGVGNALKVTNPAVQSAAYNSQFIIKWDKNTPMLEGETWKLSMDYKSDVDCSFGNQGQSEPGTYQISNIIPSMSSTSAWQTLSTSITVDANVASKSISAIAFDLGNTATSYYFDNVSMIKVAEGSAGSYKPDTTRIPKTPEQKTAIVTEELNNWIQKMMETAGGSIKDWTVIDKPMDDANPTQLRTAPANPAAGEFYWQDYLGKDYARVAVQLARQYGGNDLKLFVRDSNLVNSAKCQGLIDMIKYWEGDNVTKIDGISTILNLTYSLDATTQKANEDNVVDMLTSLKGTGKLIKIASMDMNLKNATGALINTVNVTRDQQLAMGKYYNFVIRKFFEIIPAAQRYGITLNPIESTSNAGLWNSDYSRKFTFSGVADGLAGHEVSFQ